MDIRDEIAQLRSLGKVQSNVYSEDSIRNPEEYIFDGDTILLSQKDHGVSRLYYYTLQFDKINKVTKDLKGAEYVLEFMTRTVDEYQETLKDAGFSAISHLMRMSARDVSKAFECPAIMQYADDGIGIKPPQEECVAINKVLWNVFDTRISHLLSDEEIAESIRKGEITIHKTGNRIVSILQVIEEPKKFYINQVYNGGEKRFIHAMLLQRLKHYIESGGKYAYAWVDRDNVASIKFHQKYGFSHDGMWNMVYSLRKA